MRFKDLTVGDTFDFNPDPDPSHKSFYLRCIKTGKRDYESNGMRTQVGSVKVQVYHVEKKSLPGEGLLLLSIRTKMKSLRLTGRCARR